MRALARHFTAVCYRAEAGAAGITGEPAYGTPTAFRGRIVAKARRVRSPQGEEVTSMTQVQTFEPVATSDRLWLPGADPGDLAQSVQPVGVESAAPLTGGPPVYVVLL